MSLTRARLTALSVLLAACNHPSPPPAAPPPPSQAAAPSPVASAPDAAPKGAPSAPSWDVAAYRGAIDGAIDAMLAADPPRATRAGDHRFDARWPDLSADGQARVAADLAARVQRLRALAASVPQDGDVAVAGTDHPALDARVLADHLEGIAYALGMMRFVERDPSRVATVIAEGVTGIVDHEYAPKRVRMEALATRLGDVPTLLAAARARLARPSRAGLENLVIVAKGMSAMLRGPIAVEGAKGLDDAALAARLAGNAKSAAAAIDAYAADVAKAFPMDKAVDEPIGAEKWGTLARLTEGVDESPADVRKMGEAELARLHAELDALIAQSKTGLDASKPGARAAFFARLEQDTPKPDQVLADYRVANQGVEAWMHAHRFADVPWTEAKLTIVPSPPHMRGISFASMNVAGPLEPNLTDARLQVTEPEPTMPPDRQKALLRFHAHGAIEMVSVHEAIPGHYLQFLHVRAVPSKVRKLTHASTLIEGWAHYCEQAALEEGYTGRDPLVTRAFYLRMALQRAARVVVDVAENDGSMTLAQGAKFLADNAMLAPEAAKIEARRAVVSPANMFTYTYGKLAILRLRDRVKEKEGAGFDLARFHDRLLDSGLVPIKEVGPLAFGVRGA